MVKVNYNRSNWACTFGYIQRSLLITYICAVTYTCAVYMFADKHAYVATFTKYGPIHTHAHSHAQDTHKHTHTNTHRELKPGQVIWVTFVQVKHV